MFDEFTNLYWYRIKVDSIFWYADNEEKTYQAELCFKECGIDLCSVLVFNKTLDNCSLYGSGD